MQQLEFFFFLAHLIYNLHYFFLNDTSNIFIIASLSNAAH